MKLAGLADALTGTPYSLPDSIEDLPYIGDLIDRANNLERRCLDVRERVAAEYTGRLRHAQRVTEIYESNAIEGKLATLAETDEILTSRSLLDAESSIARYTLANAIADEEKIQDVVGLAAARILVDDYIFERSRPIRENDLRDMHSLILTGHRTAGSYKLYLNEIEGSAHVPIPPVDVPSAMHQLTDWLAVSETPIVWRAAVVHAWLTHIHPFEDGNGRMARLLANYVLGFGCYPPLIVRSTADRPRYISALAHSDSAGDIVPLVRLFVRVLDRGVKLMEDPGFAWSLFQADLRVREQNVYQRWRSTANRFFEAVAAQMRLDRNTFQIVGSLSAADFEYLANRDRTGNAWIAQASSDRYRGAGLLVWAGYASTAISRNYRIDHGFPSFFLSERDPNPKAIKPYKPSVLGQQPMCDELCIIADEDSVILRRGDRLSRVKIADAAQLYAALLSGYLDRLVSERA